MRIDPAKKLTEAELEAPIREYIEPCDFSFTVDQTIADVLFVLHSRKVSKKVEYFYVTDHENRLRGILSLADILYNPPKTLLFDVLETDFVKVREEEPLEKGLKLLTSHQILSLPVINEENRFIGILEVLPAEHYEKRPKIHNRTIKEDLFQFIGFSIEQRKKPSPFREYRVRMPWLLCNLIGGLICAVISEVFKSVLIAYVILAFFIPLVLTLSESIAIQSMTLSLRFLHTRKIHWNQAAHRLWNEGKSSFLLAVTSAFIIGFFYFAWSTQILPVVSIAFSVIVAMLVSALFGGFFPIVLHALHLDPKVAAGPVVLMMADIFTIAIYLGTGTLLLI